MSVDLLKIYKDTVKATKRISLFEYSSSIKLLIYLRQISNKGFILYTGLNNLTLDKKSNISL